MAFKTSVNGTAVRVGLGGISVLAILNVLAYFGIWDLTSEIANISTLIAGIFLIMAVGGFKVFRSRNNFLAIFAVIVALVSIIGVATGILGYTISGLQPFAGITNLVLAVLLITAIWSKQL